MNAKSPKEVSRKLKQKTPERIHPKTLVVASLTAVTVALISLQLTGLVSSLTLVAIASLATAFISEFYRVGLEVFQKTVARQVERILSKNNITVEEEPASPVEEEEEVSSPPPPPLTPLRLRQRFRRVLASRWATTVVFALISFGTVAASLAIAAVTDADGPVINRRDVVQVKDVSPAQLEKIEDYAKAEAAKAAKKAMDVEASKVPPVIIEKTEEPAPQPEPVNTLSRKELLALIADLEASLEEAEADASTQADALEALQTDVDNLTRLLDRLERRQDRQEENTPQPQPNPEPSPAP